MVWEHPVGFEELTAFRICPQWFQYAIDKESTIPVARIHNDVHSTQRLSATRETEFRADQSA